MWRYGSGGIWVWGGCVEVGMGMWVQVSMTYNRSTMCKYHQKCGWGIRNNKCCITRLPIGIITVLNNCV